MVSGMCVCVCVCVCVFGGNSAAYFCKWKRVHELTEEMLMFGLLRNYFPISHSVCSVW